jgi:toxin ParE1/3/4
VSVYRLSPLAQADLDDIWNYSFRQWGEAQAEDYLYAVRDRLEGPATARIPARSAGDIRAG